MSPCHLGKLYTSIQPFGEGAGTLSGPLTLMVATFCVHLHLCSLLFSLALVFTFVFTCTCVHFCLHLCLCSLLCSLALVFTCVFTRACVHFCVHLRLCPLLCSLVLVFTLCAHLGAFVFTCFPPTLSPILERQSHCQAT